MESNQEEMTARLEAKADSHHKKFEVLWGTLLSQMDVHQAKIEANHEELLAAMKASHERIKALMNVSQEVTTAYQEIMAVNLGKLQFITEHE
jgi:flagellar hook-basal body complex protein FliE